MVPGEQQVVDEILASLEARYPTHEEEQAEAETAEEASAEAESAEEEPAEEA